MAEPGRSMGINDRKDGLKAEENGSIKCLPLVRQNTARRDTGGRDAVSDFAAW